MKKMLKILTLSLVALLVLSMASFAFAEDDVAEPVSEPVQVEEIAAPVQPVFAPIASNDDAGEELVDIQDSDVPLSPGTNNDPAVVNEAGLDLSGRNMQVIIRADKKAPKMGDEVQLFCELKGFKGLDVRYQWQVDKGDGQGWKDVRKATSDVHSFTYTAKRQNYGWRLVVTVVGEK